MQGHQQHHVFKSQSKNHLIFSEAVEMEVDIKLFWC